MLRDLRGDSSSPFGGWGNPSKAHWLTSAAGYFDERIVDLANQKSGLTAQEERVERAALSTETEVVQSSNIKAPSIPQLLLGKLKNQPSPTKPTKLTTLVKVPPSFDQFSVYDQEYRSLFECYNDSREHSIRDTMQKADELVTDESKAIAMIQKMINSFADSQSNFASALNKGSTQCRFMANKISPSTEGHNCLIRIQNSISVAFGRPHLYKNFWFGVKVYQRSPTLLFNYFPNSNSNSPTLERMIRVFIVLFKYDSCLSLDIPGISTDNRHKPVAKLAHYLETCWDPEAVDGGSDVVRLLTMDSRYQGFALYFLWRTPRSLAGPLEGDQPSVSNFVRSFCENCNLRSYSERKMLSVVIQCLVYSSKDETGVQWVWWDQYDRKRCWYRALTGQYQHYVTMYSFPLLVHCMDPNPEDFVFHREKLESLYESWKQWVLTHWTDYDMIFRGPVLAM